jgi:hypothetical protein
MVKAYVFPSKEAQFARIGKDLYESNILDQLFYNKGNEALGHICNWLFEVICLLVLSSCSGDVEATEVLEIGNASDTLNSKKVVVWGHSAGVIIEPYIRYYMVETLGPDIEFEACSVNSETMLQVAARQGSIPPFFYSTDCTKTNDGYIVATSKSPLKSIYDSSTLTFSIINGFNPCTINGIKGNLIQSGGNYIFKPHEECNLNLSATNQIMSFASTEFRNPLVAIFWCDQGVDKNDLKVFLDKYVIMTQYVENENFFIMGSITGNDSIRGPLEQMLVQEFGDHYFNGRKYLLGEAIKEIDSSTTEDDINRINEGRLPSFYMKDATHLNGKAADILSKKMVEVIVEYLNQNDICSVSSHSNDVGDGKFSNRIPVYNLSGMKMAIPYKGVTIMKGRKVIKR